MPNRGVLRAMVLAVGCIALTSPYAFAAGGTESLAEALASAYADNPTLNAQRASLRATDEGVPQALSGYRPTISADANAGLVSFTPAGGLPSVNYAPRGVSITITQPIFTGFRDAPLARVRQHHAHFRRPNGVGKQRPHLFLGPRQPRS